MSWVCCQSNTFSGLRRWEHSSKSRARGILVQSLAPREKMGSPESAACPTTCCFWPAQNCPGGHLRAGLCTSLVLREPCAGNQASPPHRAMEVNVFRVWWEDPCQQTGDANERLPVPMPSYMHHRACIISKATCIISLQKMGFSSLAIFFQHNSSRLNQMFFHCQLQPSVSLSMCRQILLEVPSGTPISGQQKGAKHSSVLIATFKLPSAECSVLSRLL